MFIFLLLLPIIDFNSLKIMSRELSCEKEKEKK
jgi:hypothetical protein